MIPELLEAILQYLDNDNAKSSRVLVNVCRLWHRLFGPYAWEKVIVPENRKMTLSGFRRNGAYVRDLTCNHVDKMLLKSVSRYSHSLEQLSLYLDHHSIWVSYKLLEKTFLGTRDRLTTISIRFDATILDTRLLWSLSRLSHLSELTLVIFRLENDSNKQVVEVLACCPGLKVFTMQDSYIHKDYVRVLGRRRLKAIIRRKVASSFSRLPDTLEEAIVRARGGGGGGSGGSGSREEEGNGTLLPSSQDISTLVHGQHAGDLPQINSDNNNDEQKPKKINGTSTNDSTIINSSMRRLQLKNFSIHAPVFLGILKSCVQLDELDVQSLCYRESFDFWSAIPQYCQLLRILRLSGRSESNCIDHIAHMITGLPRLESYYMVLHNTEISAWQSLDTYLADFEQQHHGHRHPLKTLSVMGYHKETFSTLLDVLSIRSLAIETLIVGSPWFFQIFVEHTPGNGYSPFAPFVDRQTPPRELFTRPWHTLKDSLTRLDIATTILVNRDITATFFRRLQELQNLSALHISARHILDWVPTTFRYSLPETHIIEQIHTMRRNGYGIHPDDEIENPRICAPQLPIVDYEYPVLRDIIVSGVKNVPAPFEVKASDAVFVLASSKRMEYMHLKQGSVSKETRIAIKRTFPWFFRPIPPKRLEWIAEDVY
ncbi:hypothetical protein BGZ95_007661 [Linnemannia exigua]|uniref:F-box domain-containing protein n=1 Tax=Linnemannia exigua TaxID=604196 RepID=A0AAD4H6S2_9FUNG|nr:hypothetical protein BGZ95_007661 [Linnemannia exigua]